MNNRTIQLVDVQLGSKDIYTNVYLKISVINGVFWGWQGSFRKKTLTYWSSVQGTVGRAPQS